jgi:hypothetical protein
MIFTGYGEHPHSCGSSAERSILVLRVSSFDLVCSQGQTIALATYPTQGLTFRNRALFN